MDDTVDPGQGGQGVLAGIEISPDELNELKDPIEAPPEETPHAETSKWISEMEEKAGKLFLSKVRHFSLSTGSTTTGQIGKSWPHANIQRGLVEQMKKWQEKRQCKYRSDLLFHWATNLEGEEKLKIERMSGKSNSRFLIKPIPSIVSPDEVPDNELEADFVYDPGSDNDSSIEEEKTSEKRQVKKEHRPKKKRLSAEQTEFKNNKRFKSSRDEGLVAVSSYRNRLSTDKERYRQISQDMINNIKESEIIVNILWEQNQQAEQTIAELMRQAKEFNARRESDYKFICQLREENAALHEQLRKRGNPFSGWSGSDDEDDVSDQSASFIEKERSKDYKMSLENPSVAKNLFHHKPGKRKKAEGSDEEMEEVFGEGRKEKEGTPFKYYQHKESPKDTHKLNEGIQTSVLSDRETPKKSNRVKQKNLKEPTPTTLTPKELQNGTLS